MVKITKPKFIKAVEGSGGIITLIAKKLGVTRMPVYDYVRRKGNEWTAKYLEQEREKFIDLAEVGLMANVRKKDMGAIKYALSTLGKNRGYIEKKEVEHSGSQDINFTIHQPKQLDHKELKKLEGGDEVAKD